MPYPVPEALLVEVLEANREIPTAGLATLTWGNVSGLDRASGVYVIKPSGVRYDELTLDSLVAVDVASGEVVGGTLKPSTDSETHRLLYRSFPSIGGVTHTHSTHAVAFAQANRDIPVLGTTHADTFNGPVCCTRQLTAAECETDYELNTGQAIVDLVKTDDAATAVPGALAVNHGPFTWGTQRAQVARARHHLRGRRRDGAAHAVAQPAGLAAATPDGPPLHPQARPGRLLRQR